MMIPMSITHMTMDDAANLEGVALPQYPLPSKPFPVQPAPKIGTGFAPTLVLDKSKKPVRRWRQVNREVRGIAGGRWFTRSWVGEKESEYAAASQSVAFTAQSADREAASAAAMLAAGVSLPAKLAGTSASAAPGRATKAKAHKGETPMSTLPSSRQDSAVPESISAQLPKKQEIPQAPPPDVATAPGSSA